MKSALEAAGTNSKLDRREQEEGTFMYSLGLLVIFNLWYCVCVCSSVESLYELCLRPSRVKDQHGPRLERVTVAFQPASMNTPEVPKAPPQTKPGSSLMEQ